MAIVATPTKEMSVALPCAISPAIPSVSKLCGKHTATVGPQSLGVRTAHIPTVELADQAGAAACDFRTHLLSGSSRIYTRTL